MLAKPQRACMDCYAELRRKPVGWGSQTDSGAEPEPEPEQDSESDSDSSVEVQSESSGRRVVSC